MMNKFLFSVAAIAVFSSATCALADQGLECTFPDPSNLHLHGEKVFLIFGDDDSAWVHEATAYRDNQQKPVEGQVAADTDKRTTYKWEFRYFFANSASARVLYRMNYDKGTGEAQLSAHATGQFYNVSDANGTCSAKNIDSTSAAGWVAGHRPVKKEGVRRNDNY